jgi:uncharacterized protein
MDMHGSQRITAPIGQVWSALNDPEILKSSINGCESLKAAGDNAFEATVVAKIGPIKARFNGRIELQNIDAPRGYTIVGEGSGGIAGFAKGRATVSLTEEAGATTLNYQVEASLGGKLAQLGSRLVGSVAKKEADLFFSAFTLLAESYGAGGTETHENKPAETVPQ